MNQRGELEGVPGFEMTAQSDAGIWCQLCPQAVSVAGEDIDFGALQQELASLFCPSSTCFVRVFVFGNERF